MSPRFEPGRKTLCSGGADGSVRLWEFPSGKQLFSTSGIKDGKPSLACVAFSPNGTTIAAGDDFGSILLVDAASGKERLKLKGSTERVKSVAFSPDGKLLVSGGDDKTVHLWDIAARSEICQLKGHAGRVDSVAFSPDGKRFASASMDKSVRIWDLKTHREIQRFLGHSAGLFAVSFSPDGKTIATGGGQGDAAGPNHPGEDNGVSVWDLATGKELHTFQLPDWCVTCVAFSPDGKALAGGCNDTVHVWDLGSATERFRLRGAPTRIISVLSLGFSPDGKTLAAGSFDNPIRFWDTATGKEIVFGEGHTGSVSTSICFFPDEKTLVSAGLWDGTVRLWEVSSGKHLLNIPDNFSYDVSLSPDGKIIARSGGQTEETSGLGLWDSATGKKLLKIKPSDRIDMGNGHWFSGLGIGRTRFSPDGRLIAGTCGDGVRFWETATGKESLRLHNGSSNRSQPIGQPPDDIAFSPDGRWLVSGEMDHTIRVWSVSKGRELFRFQGHQDRIPFICFSADGKILASGSGDHTLQMWELATGKPFLSLRGDQWANHVSLSPDGSILASGKPDGTLRLYELGHGTEIRKLEGHEMAVNGSCFSSNGKLLVSGSVDASLLVWDVSDVNAYAHEQQEHRNLDPKTLDAYWALLGSPDAAEAHHAISSLASLGDPIAVFLGEKLLSATTDHGNAEKIQKAIMDLDDSKYTAREQASKSLMELGDDAEIPLRKTLEGHPSPEVKNRPGSRHAVQSYTLTGGHRAM